MQQPTKENLRLDGRGRIKDNDEDERGFDIIRPASNLINLLMQVIWEGVRIWFFIYF
jgi:hypothetical protein